MQRILHLEGHSPWLASCEALYRQSPHAVRLFPIAEELQAQSLAHLLSLFAPTFLVLTGHDRAKRVGSLHTEAFLRGVRTARRYQPDPDRLFIFAGACASDAEAIQKAGANFASSPGRIPISLVDPVDLILAAASYPPGRRIEPEEVIAATRCGSAGISGCPCCVPTP